MKANSTSEPAASSQPDNVTVGAKEVLVPIDFSEASVQALRHVADMATRENIHLTLLNIIEEPISFRRLDIPAEEHKRHNQHAQQLQKLAERELKSKIQPRIVVAEGKPTEEIIHQARRLHANLIVLGRHVEHGLQRSFHSQTASHVADSAPCPVVVVDESFS